MQRLHDRIWVVVFPEGTRVLPQQQKPFKIGGAIVAERTGYSVLPIAHNAGEFWPRHSWIKWPGRIRVVIGKPIDPAGKKAEQIIKDVILNDPRSLKEPEPFMQVNNLGDFSVDFLVRVWVSSADYFQYQADMKRQVKEALDAGGVEIPFPTRTVLNVSEKATEA